MRRQRQSLAHAFPPASIASAVFGDADTLDRGRSRKHATSNKLPRIASTVLRSVSCSGVVLRVCYLLVSHFGFGHGAVGVSSIVPHFLQMKGGSSFSSVISGGSFPMATSVHRRNQSRASCSAMPASSTGGRSGKRAISDRLPPIASTVLRSVDSSRSLRCSSREMAS